METAKVRGGFSPRVRLPTPKFLPPQVASALLSVSPLSLPIHRLACASGKWPWEDDDVTVWGGRCRQSFPIGPYRRKRYPRARVCYTFVFHLILLTPYSSRPFHFIRRFCRVPEPNFHPKHRPGFGGVLYDGLWAKRFFFFIQHKFCVALTIFVTCTTPYTRGLITINI